MSNKTWINELHTLESKTLEILSLQATSIQLLNQSPAEPKKDEFEQHCVSMAELISTIQNRLQGMKKELEDGGVVVGEHPVPCRLSIAADLKKAELLQDTIKLLLDIM
jgi:hypothetical protein